MGDGGRGTSARALLIRRGAGDRVTGLLLAWGGGGEEFGVGWLKAGSLYGWVAVWCHFDLRNRDRGGVTGCDECAAVSLRRGISWSEKRASEEGSDE